MEENISEEYATLALKRFYDNATDNIQMSALVNRALVDKVSTETINQKVNNQLNSIHASMYRINPKFNETSKNYGFVKQEILDVLTDYEKVLTEYSDFYDNQLEELILKKLELESHLVGKIFKEEALKYSENKNTKIKENNKIKISFSQKAKSAFEKFSFRKNEEKIVNVQDINRLQDCIDLESEESARIDKNISKLQEINKTNMSEIVGIENEIAKLTMEIQDMNNKKKNGLENAMETREKWISITLRKPSVFTKAKSYFANKFTTTKVITRTVIAPLKIRINEFRLKELKELKG